MAFSNAGKPVRPRTQGTASGDALYRASQTAVPLRINKLFSTDGIITNTETQAFSVDGRNQFSLITYGSPGAFTVQVWGSHSNNAGSWVKIGSDITAVGETQFSGYWAFLIIRLDSLASGTLDADFVAVREG